MRKLGVILSIVIITSVFIYSMTYLSADNICSGVRIYECQKNENKNLVTQEKYIELKTTGDIFLKNCTPKITEDETIYSLDYSLCDLKVTIGKQKKWVNEVLINGEKLTREQINNNF